MSEGLPEDWEIKKLSEVAKTYFSNVDKKTNPETEKPVRLCNYMDVYSNSYIKNNFSFMFATAKQSEIDKFSLFKGDVIITKDSETPDDIAVSALVSEDLNNVICGYHLALIRPREKRIMGGFLSHLFGLDSIQHYYYRIANGSTRFGLTSEAILNSNLPLPPLPEQQKIAQILTSVDEVIEKTEDQIHKLKDLKKGMMNELLTKGIGHTEFKDSPVGRIPVEWEVKPISKLGNVITGNTPKTKEIDNYGGRILFISPSDMGDIVFIKDTKTKITKKGMRQTREIPANSVLVVCIGSTIGKIGISFKTCASNQQINTIICKNNDSKFVYYLMSFYSPKIKALAGTQAVPIINKSEFSSILVQIPPEHEQRKIGNLLFSIDTTIEKKQAKLTQTKNLKKSLMADLLTGRVRVNV